MLNVSIAVQEGHQVKMHPQAKEKYLPYAMLSHHGLRCCASNPDLSSAHVCVYCVYFMQF